MVFMPPQFGKSELVSRRLPAYLLGLNPDRRILCCSHTSTLGESLNRDVQRIVDSDRYKAIFPGTRIANPSEGGREYRRTLSYFEVIDHIGFLRSAGVGMAIAGQPADAGIIDDPFGKMEDADSDTIREKVDQWYSGDFYTRLSKDAPVLITHTRWNRDDLAGRLLVRMADAQQDQWEILCLPAVKTDKPTHPLDPRKPGESLWPMHKSESDLEAIRRNNPRVFAALYQQDPRAAGAEFPPEWFGPDVWFDEWPRQGLKVLALDPSKGKNSKWGDYSAFIHLCFEGGTIYVDADMANDRNVEVLTHMAVDKQQAVNADAFAIEGEQFQELIGDNVLRAADARKVLFPLYQVTHQGVPKEVRIRRLTPYLANGRIRFKGGSPGAMLLVDQLQDFPNGTHDDGPDALEMAVRLLTFLLGQTGSDPVAERILQTCGGR